VGERLTEAPSCGQATPIMAATTILIADDHEVVRKGLLSLFADSPARVLGEAATADDAVRQARKLKPDVVLLDVRFGAADGLDVIKRIRAAAPEAKVVILSAFDNPTYVARAVAAGAHDYLLKTVSRSELIAAVTSAASGEHATRAGELRRVAGQMSRRDQTAVGGVPLTPRENQVLRLVAMGLSNQEIADSLEISIETVKEHVQNLLRKLALGDRTQAAVWALRHGLA
jgi:DNA-binding NarL/FixJ family response regulator